MTNVLETISSVCFWIAGICGVLVVLTLIFMGIYQLWREYNKPVPTAADYVSRAMREKVVLDAKAVEIAGEMIQAVGEVSGHD